MPIFTQSSHTGDATVRVFKVTAKIRYQNGSMQLSLLQCFILGDMQLLTVTSEIHKR